MKTKLLPAILLMFEINGVVDAIRQLNDALMRLAYHALMDEGDKYPEFWKNEVLKQV